MTISLELVLLYNILDIVLISVSGTYLIVKTVDNIIQEQTKYEGEDEHRNYGTYDILMEQLNIARRKFWISFYFLELGIIAYFIFWGLMFYNNVRII